MEIDKKALALAQAVDDARRKHATAANRGTEAEQKAALSKLKAAEKALKDYKNSK